MSTAFIIIDFEEDNGMKKTTLIVLIQLFFIVLFFIGVSLVFGFYDLAQEQGDHLISNIVESQGYSSVPTSIIENAESLYSWAYILTGIVLLMTSFAGTLINYCLWIKDFPRTENISY
jgi:hypothetical protein